MVNVYRGLGDIITRINQTARTFRILMLNNKLKYILKNDTVGFLVCSETHCNLLFKGEYYSIPFDSFTILKVK